MIVACADFDLPIGDYGNLGPLGAVSRCKSPLIFKDLKTPKSAIWVTNGKDGPLLLNRTASRPCRASADRTICQRPLRRCGACERPCSLIAALVAGCQGEAHQPRPDDLFRYPHRHGFRSSPRGVSLPLCKPVPHSVNSARERLTDNHSGAASSSSAFQQARTRKP